MLFTKELVGTEDSRKPTKRSADSMSPLLTSSKKRAKDVKSTGRSQKLESNGGSGSKENENRKRTSMRRK